MRFQIFHRSPTQQSNLIYYCTNIRHNSINLFLIGRIQIINDTLTITHLPYFIPGIAVNHPISRKAFTRFSLQFIKQIVLHIEIIYSFCYPTDGIGSINILRKITYSLQSKFHSQPAGFLTFISESGFGRSSVNHRSKIRSDNHTILIGLRILLTLQKALLNLQMRHERSLKLIF